MVEVLEPYDDPALASQLLALQRAAYAVEEALIGYEVPAARETVLAPGLTWRGVRRGGQVVAAVAWTVAPDGLDVDRLVVAPAHHRQGLGRALVAEVQAEARGRGLTATVSTGRENLPARRLYEGAGFVPTAERQPLPGLVVVEHRWPG